MNTINETQNAQTTTKIDITKEECYICMNLFFDTINKNPIVHCVGHDSRHFTCISCEDSLQAFAKLGLARGHLCSVCRTDLKGIRKEYTMDNQGKTLEIGDKPLAVPSEELRQQILTGIRNTVFHPEDESLPQINNMGIPNSIFAEEMTRNPELAEELKVLVNNEELIDALIKSDPELYAQLNDPDTNSNLAEAFESFSEVQTLIEYHKALSNDQNADPVELAEVELRLSSATTKLVSLQSRIAELTTSNKTSKTTIFLVVAVLIAALATRYLELLIKWR